MNRIEKLLAELCPDGVEFRALGEVGEFIRGSGIQKSDFVETGVGCIHYGQIHTHYGIWADKTLSFIRDDFSVRLRKARKGDLVIATTSEDNFSVAKAVAWLGEDEVAVSTDACIFRHNIDCKYVSYFFQTDCFQLQKQKNITGTKVRRISIDNLVKIKIPIPPLAIQQEIVKILDKFVELQAELQKRKIQYHYYRNALLTFPQSSNDIVFPWLRKLLDKYCPDGVPIKKLSEVCEIISGYAFKGAFLNQGEIKVIRIGDIEPKIYIYKWLGICSSEKPADKYKVKKNDFLMALSGATVGKIGKIADDGEAFVNQRIALFKNSEYSALCFHHMQTERFFKYLNSIVAKSAQPNISIEQLGDFCVPFPPLEVQQKIASILDKFDTLTHDLTMGLPAEIKLRRSQYEYYRNKLLSFKEKPASMSDLLS